MHDTTRLKGVLAPVVTPFKADLSPAPERFIAHCRWLLSQHVGLAVFGTNSEANSQSVSERMELLEALVAAGLDTTRMMPVLVAAHSQIRCASPRTRSSLAALAC